MNDHWLAKAQQRYQIADKWVDQLLMTMGWGKHVPRDIRSIILSYIFYSFFRHPELYCLCPQ
jgi:hypothetical protein